MVALLSALFAAPIVTVTIDWLLIENASRYNILDEPTESRQAHEQSMPTGGGLAIAGGAILGASILLLGGTPPDIVQDPLFWFGAVLVIVAGLCDDIRGLNVKAKFIVQVIAAYCLLHTGSYFDLDGLLGINVSQFDHALITIPLSLIWIVGIINAINLIDGLDGLAGGITGIAFISSAILFGVKGHYSLMYMGIILAGTLAAFLVHNFKPASIFMGDTGSLFLGYMLASYLLQVPLHSDPGVAVLIPAVFLGFPVLDTTVAMVRRLTSRRSIFAPDCNHIHHKLSASSSDKEATLLLYAVGGWFGTAAILMGLLPASGAYAVVVCTAIVSLTWAWRRGYFRDVSESDGRPATPERTILSPQSSGDGSPDTKPVGESTEKGVLQDEFEAGEVLYPGEDPVAST